MINRNFWHSRVLTTNWQGATSRYILLEFLCIITLRILFLDIRLLPTAPIFLRIGFDTTPILAYNKAVGELWRSISGT